MISRNDAIHIARMIVHNLETECKRPEMQGPDNKARYAARGLAARCIEDLYYSLSDKVRGSFDYSSTNLFKEAGWV